MHKLLCWFGVHEWKKTHDYNVRNLQTLYGHPRRKCRVCGQEQILCRGAGTDDWVDDNVRELSTKTKEV